MALDSIGKIRLKLLQFVIMGRFFRKTFLISNKISTDRGIFIGLFGDGKRVSVLFFSTLSAGRVS